MEYQLPPGAQKLRCSLNWDYFGGQQVDLDVAALAFDSRSWETEVAFGENLSIGGGAVVHSGDARGANDGANGEWLDIDLTRLPSDFQALFLLVNCYTKDATFRSVETGEVKLILDGVECFSHALAAAFDDTAMVVGSLFRSMIDGNWRFVVINKTGPGSSFNESRPMVERELVRVFDEGILIERPRHPLTTYTLSKDEVYNISEDVSSAMVGLGWDPVEYEQATDLDGSVALFTKDVSLITNVYYQNQEFKNGSQLAIKHSGDNLTGEGEGDDEQIHVYLPMLPEMVEYVVITVNIFTDGRDFGDIRGCFVRLVNENGKSLCRFTLDSTIKGNALIMGYFFRNGDKGWRFKPIAQGCRGKRVTNITTQITQALKGEEVTQEDLTEQTPLVHDSPASVYQATTASSSTDAAGGSDGGCCLIL